MAVGSLSNRNRIRGRHSSYEFDDFVRSPISALHCISRHCGVPSVRLIPQYLHALISAFLQSRLNFDFLRDRRELIHLDSKPDLILNMLLHVTGLVTSRIFSLTAIPAPAVYFQSDTVTAVMIFKREKTIFTSILNRDGRPLNNPFSVIPGTQSAIRKVSQNTGCRIKSGMTILKPKEIFQSSQMESCEQDTNS
jgi:hypothetical protein